MRKRLTTLLIPFVYFIAGMSSLTGVAATFFYKDDLGLTLQQVQFITAMYTFAWSIKPLYGFLSDRQPLWRLRRKPYLFLAGLLSISGYLLMGLWVSNFHQAIVAVLLYSCGFAIADVIVDGIVAEQSKTQKQAGKLQSICRASLMIGAVSVAYLSGSLVSSIGARNVYLVTSILPVFTCIFAIMMHEDRIVGESTIKIRETISKLKLALTPSILWSALFLFVWRSTPNSGGALSYFVIDELQFTPELFGKLQLISYSMAIIGILVFRKWLISVSLKKLFVGIVIASIVLSMPEMALVYGWYTNIGISPEFLAIADEFLSAPLQEIGMLPLLVLVARVCPKGVEATMFALLASVMNIGLAVSSLGGAMLVEIFDVRQATELVVSNYEHLDKVLWISILSSIIPLPLLKFLPETKAPSEK